ncbi:histidine kinase [Pseudonocardia aurantiaca]|uniref:histidine kinase n=1 Tax=Pseudonocardia aurantiaca TaxID=75290 RepID=A0ABW4FR17_9PSEU
MAAADAARRRIERDLHDGVQQHLFFLSVQIRTAQAALPPGAGEAAADVRVNGRLPEPIELAGYYFVAEALTNAAKHAQASVVDVGAAAGEGVLRIEVRTTAAAAPVPRTGPVSWASPTGWRPSAAGSRCTAQPARAPPCRWRSR